MLIASLRYASENKKEVAEAVAKSSNVSTEFLINVLDGIATFKTPVEEDDLRALDYFWNAAGCRPAEDGAARRWRGRWPCSHEHCAGAGADCFAPPARKSLEENCDSGFAALALGDRPGVFRPIFCRARSTSRRAWLGCSGRRPGWFRSAPRFHVGLSMLLAFVAGAAVALTPYYVGWLRPAIDSRLTPFLNSFPGIGWTLLAIIWLGLGLSTVIFAVTVILLPFMIINIREGVRTVDQDLIEMTQSFGSNRRRDFLHRTADAVPVHVRGGAGELRRLMEGGADRGAVRRLTGSATR